MTSISKNKKIFNILWMMAGFALLLSCAKPASPEAKLAFENIIPKPVSATVSGNAFFLTAGTNILVDPQHKEVAALGQYLADVLKPATGFDLSVIQNDETSPEGIYLTLTHDSLGDEGYRLTVTEHLVKIEAARPAGLFYGIQTLRQLLPAKIEQPTPGDGPWEIATGTILDKPEYSWRGSMLDVARHFFGVEDVKRYIDLISYYKMNKLHLHLSDDQGWRIEIKSWPDLTAVGGRTQVGGGKGGFYTREQYKNIIDYAQRHYVTIIPEIDLPGHINAALVSYPELISGVSVKHEALSIPSPKAKPVAGKFYTGIDVGFSTLDIKRPATFKFAEDVLRELASITPGPYLHIGGDEASVTKKDDYVAFINRFHGIVEALGKKMIGWEDIAQADIDSTVIVQHWHSYEHARMAAEKGAKLIYSPAKKVYLDMQYDSTTKLGLHWAAYIEVDSSYMWDPATWIKGINKNYILGVEAPLWSETLETMDDVEYMLFPRLPGVAETGWTSAAGRGWDNYKKRLASHEKRWSAMGIDHYESPEVPWMH